VAAVAFGVAAVAMAGVGAFPAGTAPHFPAALVFFLAVTVVLATDGVARRGTRGGAVALALAVAHVALWAAWLVAGTSGLAVPETGGALALAAWTLAVGPAPAAPAVGDLLRARA
jgi:hypothetical membrane protein